MLRKHMSWTFGVLLVGATLTAWGQAAIGGRAGIDPDADRILRRMGNYLARATQFSFRAYKTVDFLLDSGQSIHLSDTTNVVVRRPDRVWAKSVGDTQNDQAWYDGKQLAILDRDENVYAVVEVPDNIDEMMDYVVEKLQIAVPLADMLFSDPYTMAIEKVRSGRYLGIHHVQSVKCHHLAFRQEGLDWQIWIEDGDMPVPRKLVITYKELPGHPQFIALLGKWDMAAKAPDDLFVFKAPAGAKRIDLEPKAKTEAAPAAPDGKSKSKK